MTIFPVLAVSLLMNVFAVLFVVCCVALILIVLIQKGRGGGLSSAFGGGMTSGILGSKTGDFLTWVTIFLAGVFLLLAVVLAKFYKPAPVGDYDASPTTQQQPISETDMEAPPVDTDTPATTDANNGSGQTQ